MSDWLINHLLVSHFIDSGRQVTYMLITVVNISIMLRQQINIMEDKAVECIMFKRLQYSSVVQSAFVEHSIACLNLHHITIVGHTLLLLLVGVHIQQCRFQYCQLSCSKIKIMKLLPYL